MIETFLLGLVVGVTVGYIIMPLIWVLQSRGVKKEEPEDDDLSSMF